jgi:hypothetical protein
MDTVTGIAWLSAALSTLLLLTVVAGRWAALTWLRLLDLLGTLLFAAAGLGLAVQRTGWSVASGLAGFAVLQALAAMMLFAGYCRQRRARSWRRY